MLKLLFQELQVWPTVSGETADLLGHSWIHPSCCVPGRDGCPPARTAQSYHPEGGNAAVF